MVIANLALLFWDRVSIASRVLNIFVAICSGYFAIISDSFRAFMLTDSVRKF